MEASNWQTTLSTVRERNLYAFNKSLFCDVELSAVVDSNGDNVSIPAHKYVLAIGSPVFEAMFYGKLAETGRTIKLPDCTKEGLQELLRYVYSDEVNLTGSNVMEVMCLADKYMLPFLMEKCGEYIEKEIQPEDVFSVLPHAQILNEKLEQHCWNMVDNDTQRAVSSELFLNISKEMLCTVLQRDTLLVDEVILFQAVEKWALNKIREKGLEDNRKNKRAVLGEEVIKLIRFPLMSQKEFLKVVQPSGILNMDEVTDDLAPLSDSFIGRKRRTNSLLIIPNNRFHSILPPVVNGTKWSYTRGNADAIDFKVSKAIYLVGVRLFGSKDFTYTVTLALYKNDQKIVDLSSTIPTEKEPIDGMYYGFTVTLDNPVLLDLDVRYTIEAILSGPSSYYGESSESVIVFEDIVIKYMKSTKSLNGTSQSQGQFPTLIFFKSSNS